MISNQSSKPCTVLQYPSKQNIHPQMKKLCQEKVVSPPCGPGQTKITQVVNYETRQLHCVTTPNQTITLYDNTKPNNYIVWQHQTEQLYCMTTCKNMIL